jgi:hypothetical protein
VETTRTVEVDEDEDSFEELRRVEELDEVCLQVPNLD